MILLLAACTTPDADTGVDEHETPAPLVLPDTSGVDFPGTYADAIRLAKTVQATAVWNAHVDVLDRRDAACPDLWTGAPDDASVDADAAPGQGASWFDHCASANADYDGWIWWDGDLTVVGDPETPEGRTSDASRSLAGDAVVRAGDAVLLEFDGTTDESVSRTDAGDEHHWTWSSTVQGTVTGDLGYTQALRTDLAFYATGGDANLFEPAGNVYLFDGRLHERFDSVELDLSFAGDGAAGPEDCREEPRGWIGVRDEDAFWYDVVFQPRYDETQGDTGSPAEPYADCDGCGTVYVRGVEAEALGEVCLDFGFVWDEAPLSPPDVEDFVLSLHALQTETSE